ncbi:MAG: calcium/sodium antiporter [Beijerinckiaceae bacterium]|nr:calcium/sodium antiporter [Beijerinckiaceae bacterium]
MTALFIVGGLVLLVVGGDVMVRGAVSIATRMGVSPLVIGLTLVGFGTSTPELVTSVQASLSGAPGIALGNIVGSNIANILLVLGVSAIIAPIVVTTAALKRDGAIMVAVAVMFAALTAAFDLTRPVGFVFVALLAGYIFFSFRQEQAVPTDHGAVFDKGEAAIEVDEALRPGRPASLALSLVMAIGGLALIVVGGSLLVNGAVAMARAYGVAESIIGLTVVAIGTSMPELVTAVVAAARRHSDVAFGSVVGSNIYNVLGIAGTTALIAPTSVPPEIVRFDNLVMVAVCILMMVFAWTGLRIGRREGGLLVAGYVAYLVALWPS